MIVTGITSTVSFGRARFELATPAEGREYGEVARTNLPGYAGNWRADELPWGSPSEPTYVLARLVVSFLRPDWKASFWSREYFERVARDFAHRFLVDAARHGGRVTRTEMSAWLSSQGLSADPLRTSLQLVADRQ